MHIRHITLTTGHARTIHPGEVSPEAIAVCRDIITRIGAGETSEPVTIPNVGPYSISGRASSKCLVATVWADGPPSEVIATIGIAAHSRCGASLWRNLHRWGETPVVTDPESWPEEPWIAVALDAGIVRHEDATAWLGDFERCLAVAWLAMIEDRERDNT